MLYILGDMWLPAEAYDFIKILELYQQKGMAYRENTRTIPKGEYEIILVATPVKTKG